MTRHDAEWITGNAAAKGFLVGIKLALRVPVLEFFFQDEKGSRMAARQSREK